MIYAYAIEPAVAASWTDARTFRRVMGHFGVGKPRVMLEIPAFKKWKKSVYAAAGPDGLDEVRLAEVFRALGECRVRRAGIDYDGTRPWLDNAEQEHQRMAFAAIIALANPRAHAAVLTADEVGDMSDERWEKARAATPSRSAEALTAAVSSMLRNCGELHIVDPHFGPENRRHGMVLEAFSSCLLELAPAPSSNISVTVHCGCKSTLPFFEENATKLAKRLPQGVTVFFKRWEEQHGGERFHNRYLLTDIGGVTFGVGMDEGKPGQTEDINLMDSAQYRLRWRQFGGGAPALTLVDQPAAVRGQVSLRSPQENR